MSNRILSIGNKFPKFDKTAVVSLEAGKEFATMTEKDHIKDEQWMVMFWWPKDFTFVCPTEIAEFNNAFGEFRDRDTALIGASTDSEYVHLAWRKDHKDLKGLKFPMLADTSKSLAKELGILTGEDKVALRATFSYLPIGANDLDADTDYRRNRGLNFQNTIYELALGMEFNFFEYDLSSNDKTRTPYILLEAAAFNYSGVLSNGDITKKTSYAIPIGIGFKSKLNHTFAIAIETKLRYTFKDDLDFASEIITPNLNIEGTSNDWYMFTGISLIYTFGRPSCYTKGL